MFLNAHYVGLEPVDCIPISAYKAIGASEKVPTLAYVDLVAFGLRERVDAFMDALDLAASGMSLAPRERTVHSSEPVQPSDQSARIRRHS
jgi:hypothetical protein